MNPSRDFHTHPFIVIWELTRACLLRCLHCRAFYNGNVIDFSENNNGR